jgi:hypothetical protein
MSLNFEFAEGIDKSLIEYTNKDGELHWLPRAQSFVYYQMGLQHDLTGEMTDDKLIEIARRIHLLDLYHQGAHYWEREGDKTVGYRHQLHDVITYWGLTTNVAHLSRTKWDAYYQKQFIKFTRSGYFLTTKDVLTRLRNRKPWDESDADRS